MNTFERLRKIVIDMLDTNEAKVVPETSFTDDLEADSLEIVELLTAIEDEFHIEISDKDAEELKTVQNAVDYLEKCLK